MPYDMVASLNLLIAAVLDLSTCDLFLTCSIRSIDLPRNFRLSIAITSPDDLPHDRPGLYHVEWLHHCCRLG
jgi:hypothetical protein